MDLSVVPYQEHNTAKSETDHEDGDIVLQTKPASTTTTTTSHHEPVVMNPKPPTTSSPSSRYYKPNINVIKYKECMRNHAASIGGHANDGCGEFMPCGDDGTRDWLTCAACGCHRNFHRREGPGASTRQLQQLMLSPPPPTQAPPQPQQIVLFNAVGGGSTSKNMTRDFMSRVPALPSLHHHHHHHTHHDDDDHDDNYDHDRRSETPEGGDMMNGEPGGRGVVLVAAGGRSKRFRTKFTQEQKDRMLEFAEKIGWRIQKHDDMALNQFCTEVGVKRNVLKVWMHNNKNNHRRQEALPQSPVASPPRPAPPQPVGV